MAHPEAEAPPPSALPLMSLPSLKLNLPILSVENLLHLHPPPAVVRGASAGPIVRPLPRCLPSQPSALCRRPSYPSELTLPASIAVLFPKHQPPSAFLGSHSSTCHLRVRFLFVAHLPAPVQPPARPRLSRPPASPCPHSLCVLIHWASIQDTHQAPASALWWGTGRRPPLSLRRIGSTLRLRSSRAAVRGH